MSCTFWNMRRRLKAQQQKAAVAPKTETQENEKKSEKKQTKKGAK